MWFFGFMLLWSKTWVMGMPTDIFFNHVNISNDCIKLKKSISSKGDNEIWLNGLTIPNFY